MIGITVLFTVASCVVKQPIMVLPDGLQTNAEVMAVTGRQGFLLLNRDIQLACSARWTPA